MWENEKEDNEGIHTSWQEKTRKILLRIIIKKKKYNDTKKKKKKKLLAGVVWSLSAYA